jgi:hypothetical protein
LPLASYTESLIMELAAWAAIKSAALQVPVPQLFASI